jgi:tetratricopeptide (TPR) repeat protein
MKRSVQITVALAGAALVISIVLWRSLKRDGGDASGGSTPAPDPGRTASATSPIRAPQPPAPSQEEGEECLKAGVEHLQAGHPQRAIVDFDRALKIRKDWPEVYYNRAVAKVAAQDYGGAVLDYDKMIELHRDGPETYYNRGVAKLALGRHADAAADFDRALRGKPDWLEAHYNLGLAREGMKDYRQAEQAYAAALRLAPPGWPSRAALEGNLARVRKELPKAPDERPQ